MLLGDVEIMKEVQVCLEWANRLITKLLSGMLNYNLSTDHIL